MFMMKRGTHMRHKQYLKISSFLMIAIAIFSLVFISSTANDVDVTNGLVQNTVNQTSEVDRALDPAMILKIDTEKFPSAKNVILPFRGATNVTVDYGNGVVIAYTTPGQKDYVYPVGGIYEITISGTLEAFGNINSSQTTTYARGILKIIEVVSFGNLGITDFSGAFRSASSLTTIPSVFPTTVTNVSLMFAGALNLTTGDISSWDVSNVTNMSGMFDNNQKFNPDVSSWDVSNVTDMSRMFFRNNIFNQNISIWNTSKVTNMSEMFSYAALFNQPIGSWDVSNVTNFRSMFNRASNFNQPLDTWNVSSATTLSQMFESATKFNQPLGSWNISKVTDLSSMFYFASEFNQPLNTWDTSNVTNMAGMFVLTKMTHPLDLWNTSNVVNMTNMFSNSPYNGDITTWDTSSVTNMSGMFNLAGEFNQDITNWDVSKVLTTVNMFRFATKFDQPIGVWDVSSVIDMRDMFRSASIFNQPLNNWNVSNVTNMSSLFRGASKFNQPLDTWNTSKVTNMSYLFNSAVVFNQPLDMWDISNVTTIQGMFAAAFVFNQPLNSWNTSNVTNMIETFQNARVYDFDLDQWNTSNVVNMSEMFSGASIFNSNITTWDTKKVISMSSMFSNTNAFNQPIGVWDTSGLNGSGLLGTFSSAKAFNQNINTWHTTNIQNLSGTFGNATVFNQPLDQWDTNKLNNLSNAFNGALAFNQDITGWNTSLVTSFSGTFSNTDAFNQPIGVWNTERVTNMSNMFNGARVFNQDISNWNTGNVTNMSNMFNGARVFDQPIGNWNTAKVITFELMFFNAFEFNQPIGNWNTSNVTNMRLMFGSNIASDPLPKFNQDISAWDFAKVFNLQGFMSRIELSPYHFDKLLQRFLDQTITLQNFSGRNLLSFSETRYSKIGAGLIDQLITDRGWSITVKGPLEVTISVEPATKLIGENDPAYTLKYVNLYKEDTGSAVTGIYTITRAPGELEGSYDVNLSGFEDEPFYYVIVEPTSTFTITNPFARTVTFKDSDDNVLSETTFQIGDSLSPLVLPTVTAPLGFIFKEWSIAIPAVMPDAYLVLTPVFVEGVFKLTFVVDGVGPLVYDLAYLANTTTPVDPTKVGHTFRAWDQTIPTTMPSEDVTITALFDINTYTIQFNSNLGSALESIDFNYNQSIQNVLSPTRTGYTFEGWSPALPTTMPAENLSVEALWTINSYDVTFDTAGGNAIEPLSVDFNDTFNLPTPTRTGYTFKGFVETKPETMPAENLTFTATWDVVTYTITYVLNDGVNSLLNPSQYDITTTRTLIAPTRVGHTFDGWFTDTAFTTPKTNIASNTGDVTLYAKFTVNRYTITFDSALGSDVTPLTFDYNALVTAPSSPTRTGYTFEGWNEAFPVNMPAENLVFTATWDINTYTITFNTNGGTVIAPITLDFGSTITTPSNPTRLGYTFKSWDTAIPVTMPAENVTISATWDINAYTITFNTNGGTAIDPMTLDFGTTIPSVTQPTREGYIFNAFSIDIPTTMPAENLTISVSWIFINVVKDDDLEVEVDGLFDAIPETLKTNEDISVSLVIKLNEEEASNQSQQLIKAQLESNQQAQFLDIYVLLTTNQVEVRVSELAQLITVSLVLPEALQGFEGYQIVSVHNGVYRELETEFDEETQTVTFVTDTFSSYAIVYGVITTGPLTLYIILGISTLLMFIAFKRDKKDKDQKNKKSISDVISNTDVFEEDEVKVLSRRKK